MFRVPKMVAVCSSENMVSAYKFTRRYNPEENIDLGTNCTRQLKPSGKWCTGDEPVGPKCAYCIVRYSAANWRYTSGTVIITSRSYKSKRHLENWQDMLACYVADNGDLSVHNLPCKRDTYLLRRLVNSLLWKQNAWTYSKESAVGPNHGTRKCSRIIFIACLLRTISLLASHISQVSQVEVVRKKILYDSVILAICATCLPSSIPNRITLTVGY